MPIPNEAQVTYKDQAEVDLGDMAMWENVDQGYSVISGGAVTEQGTPDGTVAVAAGVAKVGGAAVTITAGSVSVLSGSANPDGSTSLAADSTQARFSLVVVDSLGRLGVLHGPNGALSPTGDGSYTDVFPTFVGKTVLASVRIPPGFTTVAASMLSDKRYFRTDGDFVARVLTPAALSANAADYAPTSAAAWAAANVLRQATNNSTQRNISGFSPTGHIDGKEITVINLGPGPLGLQNQNTGSAAANRFAFAADVVLPSDRAFKIFYDVTSTRWRALGGQTPSGAPAIVLGTAAASGSSVYYVRDDATIVAFDATVPVTQAFSDAAATGAAAFAARRDHKHGMPAGSMGLATDPLAATKGDIPVASANDVFGIVPAPTVRGQRLGADEAGNVAWAPTGSGPAGVRESYDFLPGTGSFVTADTGRGIGFAQIRLTGTLSAFTVGALAGTPNHPGSGRFGTGTTATGTAHVALGGNQISLGGGRARYGAWLQLPALSTGAQRFEAMAGFADNVSAATIVDGCFFHYRDDVNGGKWEAITIANSVSTATVTDTGVTVNVTQFYRLEIEVNAAGTSVAYYVDGALVATHAANIPVGAGRETGLFSGLTKSVGTTSSLLDIDAHYLELDFTTPR